MMVKKKLLKIFYFLIILNLSEQMSVGLVADNESKSNDIITNHNSNLPNQQKDYFKLDDESDDDQTLDNKRVLEIYKIIMIFTCCVLAIVLICFLICILRNSDVLVANSSQSQDNLNLNAVYSNFDENSNNIQNSNNLLINLPFEKPPSYIDVLKEIGHPPPIYSSNNLINQQSQIVTELNPGVIRTTAVPNLINITTPNYSTVQHNELILDCNRWLEQSNNERSDLEARLLETRLIAEYRENLRRLSRDLERCYLPNNILLRSHSSPVIRNSILLRTQHLLDANNDLILSALVSNSCSSANDTCANLNSHQITGVDSNQSSILNQYL